jgi:peptidoglycan lytic transglycosylase
VLWRLFYAPVPVEAKKDALYEIARVEYGMKRYEKAFAYYRMFGLYYPGDDRAIPALDTAARTAVLLGRWEEALDTWSLLRKRGGSDTVSSEAALSEGVLRYIRGRTEEANEIFNDLLPRANETLMPSVLYWLAQTSLAVERGAVWSDRLSRVYPRSFYARAAAGETANLLSWEPDAAATDLSTVAGYAREALDSIPPAGPPADSLPANPAFEAYLYFLDRALPDEAGATLAALLAGTEQSDAELLGLFRRTRESGSIDCSFDILNSLAAGAAPAPLPWEWWYPIVHAIAIEEQGILHGIPPDLILAVIREESRFNERAESSDGARGLMQLMPSTAVWWAERIGAAEFEQDDLYDAYVNIKLGASYLAYLRHRFNDSMIAALAAYNAGEGRMARWNEDFSSLDTPPLAALEMIGPRETRRYVKKVLDSLSAYRAMSEKARLK